MLRRTRAQPRNTSSANATLEQSIFRKSGANLTFVTQYRISQAAALLGVSDDTVRRWVQAGRLSQGVDEAGRQAVNGPELAALAQELAQDDAVPTASGRHSAPHGAGSTRPRISARNRAVGLVTAIKKGDVAAQVDVQCGPFRFVSLMTREAVEDLELKVGDIAAVVVKATNVIVESGN